MLPKWHILFGAIVSLIIWLIEPSTSIWAILTIFLSSVLIDVDHYIYYLIKRRDIRLSVAYREYLKKRIFWHGLSQKEKENYSIGLIFMHGIEFIIILLLLSLVHEFFMWVLIGSIIHILLDLSELYMNKDPLYFKLSQIYVFFRNKGKKDLI